MSPSKPAQPKDAQDRSGEKGSCFVLTRPNEAARLTPIIVTQIPLRLTVVLYRFLLPFLVVRFPH